MPFQKSMLTSLAEKALVACWNHTKSAKTFTIRARTMALPRLCSEGVKALARLAQQGGKQAQNRLHPACTTFSRSYAAEPVPAEGEALSFTERNEALHKECHRLAGQYCKL